MTGEDSTTNRFRLPPRKFGAPEAFVLGMGGRRLENPPPMAENG
jgi:hypothetical protein